MKRYWKILGIVTLVAIVGVVTIGAVALAQDSGNGTNAPFDFGARLREAIANVLGISVDEYDSAVDTAQTQVLEDAVSEGVLTQDQADRIQERADQGFGLGMDGGFFGFGGEKFGRGFGHGDFLGGQENSLVSVAADKLGMTESELTTELRGGKSIADVAGEKGVNTQTIVDAYIAQLKATLDQAVTDGRITQTQADTMLQREQDRVPDMLNNTFEDRMPGGFFGFGHGDFLGGSENSLVPVAADKLGMTVSELTTELRGGKSIADVAGEKGVDTQTIVDAYIAQLKTTLDQAVADGRITQTQADTMLQREQDRVPDMLDNTFENRMPGGFRGGRGPGRFQPPTDQDNV